MSAGLLRSMAVNYAGGHLWDHLDSKACNEAADLIDTLRAQLEAAEADRDSWSQQASDRVKDWAEMRDLAEAAEAECAAMRERMHFLATDGSIEGFVNVESDIYDYACDYAEEAGRDEPNEDDLINGLCRLIDAARTKEETK